MAFSVSYGAGLLLFFFSKNLVFASLEAEQYARELIFYFHSIPVCPDPISIRSQSKFTDKENSSRIHS